MKKLILLLCIIFTISAYGQKDSVGTSSLFEPLATTKGIFPPRLTTKQGAIGKPTEGLSVKGIGLAKDTIPTGTFPGLIVVDKDGNWGLADTSEQKRLYKLSKDLQQPSIGFSQIQPSGYLIINKDVNEIIRITATGDLYFNPSTFCDCEKCKDYKGLKFLYNIYKK